MTVADKHRLASSASVFSVKLMSLFCRWRGAQSALQFSSSFTVIELRMVWRTPCQHPQSPYSLCLLVESRSSWLDHHDYKLDMPAGISDPPALANQGGDLALFFVSAAHATRFNLT